MYYGSLVKLKRTSLVKLVSAPLKNLPESVTKLLGLL